jgi:hypothetical protein
MKKSITLILNILFMIFLYTPMLFCQFIFTEHPIDQTFTGAAAIDIKDLNKDGRSDIVSASHGTQVAPSCGVKCWISNGAQPGSFTAQIIDASYRSIACYAEDLNGDGYGDVMAASWTANSIVYWINSGTSPIIWTRYTLATNFSNAHGVYAGDFDGDGDNDILGAAAGINEISIWINNGGNPISWEKRIISSDFLGVRSVYGGDIDEDGDLDFVATALASNELAWWRNDGGTPIIFTKFTLSTDFVGAHWAILYDIDRDSHLDILGAAWADNEISWWRNNFDISQSWTKYFMDTTFTGGFFATAADFDNDSDTDIFGTTQPGNMQSYWINNGTFPYTWSRKNLVSSNSQPWPAAPLDVDGDGRTDIVSGGNTMLGWWENISNVPYPPSGFKAYSDFNTPNSIKLTWNDPTIQIDGNHLKQFSIHVYRGSSLVAVVDSGQQQFIDEPLINHQIYSYSIRTVTLSESSSVATVSTYAGGCPYAFPPTLFTVRDSGTGIQLQWKNPTRNIDGSLLVDTFFLMIYRRGVLIDSLEQTHLDTGMVRQYYDTSQGYHEYQLRIRDNDNIPHYSSWTGTLLGYGGVPNNRLLENFESGCIIPYHNGTWDITQSLAFKSKYSFTDSPTGNSPNYSNVFFQLPPVRIDDALMLSFFDIAIVVPGNSANIEISRDGRKTFSNILGYDWNAYEPWQDGSADSNDWKKEILDLAPYIGDTITIRFRLYTYSGYTSDGWYIDSLRIQPPDPPPPTPLFSLTMRQGWNMISVPLKINEMEKNSIFPSSTSFAFTFNGTYTICESLQTGTGYWIKQDDPVEKIFEGAEITNDTVEIRSGWNMIGSISTPVYIGNIITVPPDMSCSDFFGYDSIYHQSDTLNPGKGYWVKANMNGSMILSIPDENSITSKIKISLSNEIPPNPPFEDGTISDRTELPTTLQLFQNFPNPFNASTIFRFSIFEPSPTTLKVFDLLGREIVKLVDEIKQPGEYNISWDAQNITTGLYYYRLETSNCILTKKLILLK